MGRGWIHGQSAIREREGRRWKKKLGMRQEKQKKVGGIVLLASLVAATCLLGQAAPASAGTAVPRHRDQGGESRTVRSESKMQNSMLSLLEIASVHGGIRARWW